MKTFHNFLLSASLAAAIFVPALQAQHLSLEGQTGGFLTPTAYVVPSGKGHILSYPAIGYHFINTSDVIGRVQTFHVTEGLANRAEIGYTRSIHSLGNSAAFSKLWDYSGMNILHGKVVLIKDGQGSPFTPGLAVGGLVRFDDHYVSGAIQKAVTGVDKGFTNGDFYVAVTKTWAHPPVPFLVNLGWKTTNASIFGLGGQANGFKSAFFGGLGIPLPIAHNIVAVPSAGFTQEPRDVKNLATILPGGVHIPTTLDYAVRITQKDNPHFSFDAGIGHVAGTIGTTYVTIPGVGLVPVPVDLKANKVFGMGASFRY